MAGLTGYSQENLQQTCAGGATVVEWIDAASPSSRNVQDHSCTDSGVLTLGASKRMRRSLPNEDPALRSGRNEKGLGWQSSERGVNTVDKPALHAYECDTQVTTVYVRSRKSVRGRAADNAEAETGNMRITSDGGEAMEGKVQVLRGLEEDNRQLKSNIRRLRLEVQLLRQIVNLSRQFATNPVSGSHFPLTIAFKIEHSTLSMHSQHISCPIHVLRYLYYAACACDPRIGYTCHILRMWGSNFLQAIMM